MAEHGSARAGTISTNEILWMWIFNVKSIIFIWRLRCSLTTYTIAHKLLNLNGAINMVHDVIASDLSQLSGFRLRFSHGSGGEEGAECNRRDCRHL